MVALWLGWIKIFNVDLTEFEVRILVINVIISESCKGNIEIVLVSLICKVDLEGIFPNV